MRKRCLVDGCETRTHSRGLCKKHLKKWIEGSAEYEALPSPKSKYQGQPCCVDGCHKMAYYNDMCFQHGERVQNTGSVILITNEEFRRRCKESADKRKKPAKPTTYKKFHSRHEHRVVAEMKIGRPLIKGEIVHHIDGNKHNNHPDNLEVMTQSEHVRIHDLGQYRRKNKTIP